MEMNNLNDMAAFISSVKSGSFTKAGKQMGLTRSTIGKRIAKLEQRLNVRLLNRNTRNLSLTDEGRLFYERCVAVLEELENAEQCLVQRSIIPGGKLKISAPVTLGRLAVAPLAIRFMQQYPQLEIELSMSDRYVDLVEEGFDVAVRVGTPNPDSGLLARTIGTQRMLTCAAPDYLQQHGEPGSPDDLAAHACLHFIHNGRISAWQFRQHGKPLRFSGSARFSADHGETLISAAVAGLGIVQMPHYLVNHAIASGALQALLADFMIDAIPIQAVYPSRRQLSPKVRLWIDFLRDNWAD
ncbi:LysR family transcriptional regulator [Testudinibacter aquarius]|uniref:LysR family transcriptional regulator n=1 Tax=Testudinibacter aquarius TaxID=1524974 RepID=A0A4R3YA34_9PAST|nr:LysR family transcriptional regulator [Testudinibacter aquarius]KAE9528969.1 LysR family transcriptional regulator [Testudinibacter aquarius]TCV89245.1 LysR family transcriptional regulator [Testudinibacter aquarius]TNG93306.1 LysR family transcriptional regulator [Testudinibacter aquarius]